MFRTIVLFLLVSDSIARNSYVITTPKDLRPGTPFNIGVNILRASGRVDIKAKLISHKIVSTVRGIFSQGFPGILKLNVPASLKSGSYKIRISGSGGLSFAREKYLDFKKKRVSVFIQTDKAIYKAGQTVRFRAFALYPNLRPYNGRIDIKIYDPQSNKIQQWLNAKTNNGVFDNLLKMDAHPLLGKWKITATSNGVKTEKEISVKEYVLPKFEISVELPSYIVTTSKEIHGSMKAMYTYGKAVIGKGMVTARLEKWYKRWGYNGPEPKVQIQDITLDLDGKANFKIPLGNIMTHSGSLGASKLRIEVNITESVAHNSLSSISVVPFTHNDVKITFLSSSSSKFKPGLPYIGYISVTNRDGKPIPGVKSDLILETTIVHYDYTKPWKWQVGTSKRQPNKSYKIPVSGNVKVEVQIPKDALKLKLKAKYKNQIINKTVKKSHSPSGSYIQMELKSTNIKVGDTARIKLKSTKKVGKLTYQVLARGKIVATNIFNGQNRNEMTFQIPLSANMAPFSRIILYKVRNNGEIVVDSIGFNVEGIFKNMVSVSFNKAKAKPGEDLEVLIRADPESLVTLLVVDKSVKNLQSGNDITASEVLEELTSFDSFRSRTGLPVHYCETDTKNLISNLRVNMLTDATLYNYKPNEITVKVRPPSNELFIPKLGFVIPAFITDFDSPIEKLFGNGKSAPAPAPYVRPPNRVTSGKSGNGNRLSFKPPNKIRKHFPETWLWLDGKTGNNGQLILNSTMPDTITSWVASAFAIHQRTGLGINSSPAEITGFQHFFIRSNLPYSVIRDEEVALEISVFNYLQMDIPVMVILKPSKEFKSIVKSWGGTKQEVSTQQIDSIYVEAGKAKSVFFPIVAKQLGLISIEVQAMSFFAADAVKQKLLVEPEGIPKEYNKAVFIGLSKGNQISKNIKLTLPHKVVPGSAHARISVIGDFMGPTLHNLDHLLRMPTGCGEQTMLGLAPDVFVANYLHTTGQLSKQLKKKLIDYIERGYQRELKYQRRDGSFSAFGNSDRSGSMWLSAFVVKTFHQAKQHIYVDKNVLQKTIKWIIAKQSADGSFIEPGRVIHKNMQGGSARGQGLTAFVLIALQENGDLNGSIRTKISIAAMKARRYLERRVNRLSNTYDLAIISYALKLSESPIARQVIRKLNTRAIIQGDMRYWRKTNRPLARGRSDPIDIEMTSYALLVYSRQRLVGNGLRILRWLLTQRNPNGGFVSTQDTVLALQSLSEYATIIQRQKPNMYITISTGSTVKRFKINSRNSLLLQTMAFQFAPKHVNIKATGEGLGLVEIAVFFNVEKETRFPTFDITVNMIQDTLNSITLQACTRRKRGNGNGMAIQEIGIPTGFSVNVDEIAPMSGLRKIEEENRKVIIYFNEITSRRICVVIKAVRTGLVANMKPSAVRVYDYYEPTKQVTSFYQANTLKKSTICDVCLQCKLCRKYRMVG